ncbi:MAG: PilZ domain-containing protein [Candidatus Omnitrophota bacterium]
MDKKIDINKPHRQYTRVKDKLAIYYKTDTMHNFKGTMINDISGGGIQLVLNDKLAIGTPLSISINIPGSHKPIEVKGEVRNYEREKNKTSEGGNSPYLIGIEFIEICLSDRMMIIDYVHSIIRDNVKNPDESKN